MAKTTIKIKNKYSKAKFQDTFCIGSMAQRARERQREIDRHIEGASGTPLFRSEFRLGMADEWQKAFKCQAFSWLFWPT